MLYRKMNVALLALCMSASVAVGCGPDDDPAGNNDNNTTADMGGGGGGTSDMGGGGGTDDMGGGGGTDDMGGGGSDMTGGTDMGGGGTDMGGGGDDMTGGNDMSGGGDDMATPAVCGDGAITGNEACDGDCPTSPLECDDNDACTINAIMGSAAQCSAVCDFSAPVTACDGGASDGCCPAGCDGTNDADCGTMNMPGQPGSACSIDGDCGAPGTGSCISEGQDPDFVDGYCLTTIGCQTDVDCGGDGLCLTVDQNGTTACVDGCVADGDCRTGYTCQDLGGPTACLPEEDPATQGNGNAGIACTADVDCGADSFCLTEGQDPTFVGGYCVTALGCADGTCGGDNICLPLDQNGTMGCIDGCVADSECRTGYICEDIGGVSACLPAPVPITGQTGIACASDAQCDAAEVCIGPESGFVGGYCSRGCQADAECPTGSACHINDTDNNTGFCLDNCMTNTDCRTPNYECFEPFAASTVDACFPVASGSGLVGDVCTSVSDCAGGQSGFCITDSQGFSGGYCSIQCLADADCGAGSHCGFLNPATPSVEGVCLANCTTDADCRTPGYVCGDGDGNGVNECFTGSNGVGAPGDACQSISDCAGGVDAFCLEEADNPAFTGGYCLTSGCTTDADCGAGGYCLAQNGGQNLCTAGCTTDADCRAAEGYTCQPDTQGGPNVVCLPAP